MTYNPATLKTLGAYWTAQGGVNLGVVGNTAHTKGYHLGRDRIYSATGEGDKDYSVRLARDRAGLSNAASAIDLGRLDGSLGNLRAFSRWLVARAQADPDKYRDIREVIYSPDGAKVQRYSGVDGLIHTGPGNGDASHITHTHISFFRDAEHRDKVSLFAGYFAPPPDTGTEEPVMDFTLLHGPDGRLITGTLVVDDEPGIAYFRFDGRVVQATAIAGKVKQAVKVRMKKPVIAGKPDTDDWKLGYVMSEDAAFILDRNVTFTPYATTYPVKVTVGTESVSGKVTL